MIGGLYASVGRSCGASLREVVESGARARRNAALLELEEFAFGYRVLLAE